MRFLICYAVYEPKAQYFSFRNALTDRGQTVADWILGCMKHDKAFAFVSANEISDEDAVKLEEEGLA